MFLIAEPVTEAEVQDLLRACGPSESPASAPADANGVCAVT